MKKPGQIILFRFPQTDLLPGKLRPAVLVGLLPGNHKDWLLCMISTQMHHYIPGFDERIETDHNDFQHSGLKEESLIRTGRLAVVEEGMLLGTIGEIAPERLHRIKKALAKWLQKT